MVSAFLKTCAAGALVVLTCTLNGQNEIEALRYSNTHFGGTARYNGMAGAFGAVGADLSVLSTNPAGMARFRKSEISITPYLNINRSWADFNKERSKDFRVRVNLGNVGFVGTRRIGRGSSWKSVQFGIAYNQLANFYTSAVIRGFSKPSIAEDFANRGWGIEPTGLADQAHLTSMAYETYLIDYDSSQNSYFVPITKDSLLVNRTRRTAGTMGEMNFAFSANYRDKIYLGAELSWVNVDYSEDVVHNERVLVDSTNHITDFTYTDNLTSEGSGINLKVGIIALPTDWVRLGMAVHTGSMIGFTENWKRRLSTTFDELGSNPEVGTYTNESPDGQFSYRLRTPAKYIGSAAFIINRQGMISADFELVDYARAAFRENRSFGAWDVSGSNEVIKNTYKQALNVRVGTEWKIGNDWLIRGGYAAYESPFQNNLTQNSWRQSYTGGVGYRINSFYMDLAYVLSHWTEDYYMYDPGLVARTDIRTHESRVMWTIGVRF